MRFLALLLLGTLAAAARPQSSLCPGGTELGDASGSATMAASPGGGRGSFRQYTGPTTTLTSYSQEFNLAGTTEMMFQVYEGPSATGPWSLVGTTTVAGQGPGPGEYDSGPMAVTLQSGLFYAIITYTQVGGSTYYFETSGTLVYSDWVQISRAHEFAYPPSAGPQTFAGVLYDCHQWLCTGSLVIPLVDTAATTVILGQTGVPVTVDVENLTGSLVDSLTATLSFTGTADRTSEYTVTPDPANPTSVAAGATETLLFHVDVSPGATEEIITLDADAAGFDTGAAVAVQVTGADVTDTWEVLGCQAPSCGDCSGDLTVSILDALFAAQHAAGLITLTGTDFSNCNVTGTFEPDPTAAISILDALTLAQFAAGLLPALTCC
jgi:hypothetical protein